MDEICSQLRNSADLLPKLLSRFTRIRVHSTRSLVVTRPSLLNCKTIDFVDGRSGDDADVHCDGDSLALRAAPESVNQDSSPVAAKTNSTIPTKTQSEYDSDS